MWSLPCDLLNSFFKGLFAIYPHCLNIQDPSLPFGSTTDLLLSLHFKLLGKLTKTHPWKLFLIEHLGYDVPSKFSDTQSCYFHMMWQQTEICAFTIQFIGKSLVLDTVWLFFPGFSFLGDVFHISMQNPGKYYIVFNIMGSGAKPVQILTALVARCVTLEKLFTSPYPQVPLLWKNHLQHHLERL